MNQFYLTQKMNSIVSSVLILLGLKAEHVGKTSATTTAAINFNTRNAFGLYSFKAALVFLLLASFSASAQTTIINGTTTGSFESTFAADGWIPVAGATPTNNIFAIGNAATIGFTPTNGTRGVFVTNNGTSRGYAHTSAITWIYKDVTLPAGETLATMTMDLFGNCGDTGFDGIVVGITDQTYSASCNNNYRNDPCHYGYIEYLY
jgi:hypothetical protein